MAEFNFKKAKEYGAIFDIYSDADNTAVYNVEVEYDQFVKNGAVYTFYTVLFL